MAINVLLDTCVLKKLVSRTEFSGYLKQIISWHNSGEIIIYSPKKLLDEWEVHRKKELSEINRIIKDHVHKIKMGNLFNIATDIGDAQLTAADKLLRSQVEAIDQLLNDGVQARDGQAATKMWDHKQQRKAPFRVKTESDNDAMILFCTFEELILQQESELYFFSSNHNDYAAPGNTDQIHSDILESYPGITVKYFSEYVEGINALIQLGLSSTKTTVKKRQAVEFLVAVDRNLSVAEQLHQYLVRKLEDINVLPKRLFAVHYPFVISELFNKGPQAFTLETDNPEIYDWVVQLPQQLPFAMEDRTETELLDPRIDQKLLEIIRALRSCYVHRISFNNKIADVPTLRGKLCTCLNCVFSRSDFKNVFSRIEIEGHTDNLDMKKAYLHYQVGDIPKAVEILEAEAKKAEAKKRWLTYYIANYNLVLIGRMYRLSSSEERELPWVEALQKIQLDDIYTASCFSATDEVLNYLKEARFMSDATERAKELALKIKNDHLDGGRGWNSYTRDLLDLYFETIGFIENNYIMLDYFSDVTFLTYHFIDGIFASYTCHKELGGKLMHFTDPIIEHIVSYAKSDDIITCRNRYDIRVAEFVHDGQRSKLVSNLVNLLNSYEGVLVHYSQSGNDGQRFFWKRFRTQFHNGLILTAIMEISEDDVSLICEALLPFLKVERHFGEFEIAKTVSYFIKNNANLINKRYLEEFLLHAYTAENVQRDMFIHTISNVSRIEDLELRLTHAQWDDLQARYLVNTDLDDRSTSVSEICCLYDFLKVKSYQDEIAKFMTDYLKFNFNSEVYYTAVIHKMIKPTRKLNALYEKDMLRVATEGRRPRIFEKSYYNSVPLDEYINFKFSLNQPFDARFVDAVKDLDNYYRWILDLDGFDYRDFNTDWLFNHLTTYYRKHFRQSKTLQYHMRKYALNGKDPLVGRFYIELYTSAPDALDTKKFSSNKLKEIEKKVKS